MRLAGIIFTAALASCASAALATTDIRRVETLQRVWDVTQVADVPLTFKAVRQPMPDSFFFFGPPARLKTIQATSAIEAATGCRVLRSSMYQNISAEFFSQVTCPASGPRALP
jgi:hypothetical protein